MISYLKTSQLILEQVRAENFKWVEHYEWISHMDMVIPNTAGSKKIVLRASFALSSKSDQYYFWDVTNNTFTDVNLHTSFLTMHSFACELFFTKEERAEIDYYFKRRLTELNLERYEDKKKDDESFFNFFKKLVDKLK